MRYCAPRDNRMGLGFEGGDDDGGITGQSREHYIFLHVLLTD